MRLEREAALQNLQLQIAVISGIRTGKVFSLAQGDSVIGRDEAADLHIADEFVRCGTPLKPSSCHKRFYVNVWTGYGES